MADKEVEEILHEIRARVLEDQKREGQGEVSALVESANGNKEIAELSATRDHLDACLTTTRRAWDRLPPVVSNRSGTIARIELWIKNVLKRCSRWFTWEQVNFNAAVDQALKHTRDGLSLHGKEIEHTRDALSLLGEKVEGLATASQEQVAQIAQLRRQQSELIAGLQNQVFAANAQLTNQEALIVELGNMQVELATRQAELSNQLEQLAKELRDRDEQLMGEQRVCFKQLVVELGETSVLQDRIRRNLESRLEELEEAIASRSRGLSAR